MALGPLALSADGRVVWHRRQRRYLTLDQPAAEALLAVAARDGGLLNEILASGVDRRMLDALEQTGVATVWSESDGLPVPRRRVWRHAALQPLVRLLLAVSRGAVLSWIVSTQDPPARVNERSGWCGLDVELSVAAANEAMRLPWMTSRCLPASLGLWLDLRLSGHPAVVRLGAIVEPFHAHAWVELHEERIDLGGHAFPTTPITNPRLGSRPTP